MKKQPPIKDPKDKEHNNVPKAAIHFGWSQSVLYVGGSTVIASINS
jgi:hypothetical protein